MFSLKIRRKSGNLSEKLSSLRRTGIDLVPGEPDPPLPAGKAVAANVAALPGAIGPMEGTTQATTMVRLLLTGVAKSKPGLQEKR